MCLVGLAGGTYPLSAVSLILRGISLVGCYVGNKPQMAALIELYHAKQVRVRQQPSKCMYVNNQ